MGGRWEMGEGAGLDRSIGSLGRGDRGRALLSLICLPAKAYLLDYGGTVRSSIHRPKNPRLQNPTLPKKSSVHLKIAGANRLVANHFGAELLSFQWQTVRSNSFSRRRRVSTKRLCIIRIRFVARLMHLHK